MDRILPQWTELDRIRPNGPNMIKVDRIRPKWTVIDELTEYDQSGPNKTKMDLMD